MLCSSHFSICATSVPRITMKSVYVIVKHISMLLVTPPKTADCEMNICVNIFFRSISVRSANLLYWSIVNADLCCDTDMQKYTAETKTKR